MLKKTQWIMMNIITFILIVLFLFLPMFKLQNIGGEDVFADKTLFGFHFLTGYTTQNMNDMTVQIIASKLVGFVLVMMLLSMWIINRLTHSDLGKDIINFLCLAVCFVFIFLLPVIAPTFLNKDFQGMFEFTRLAGYWVNFVFICLAFIYYMVIMIYKIVKTYKLNKENA